MWREEFYLYFSFVKYEFYIANFIIKKFGRRGEIGSPTLRFMNRLL